MAGYLIWLFFFIMPILGLIIGGVKNGEMRIECAKDQKDYMNAVAANANAQTLSHKKAALDECNAQLSICMKNWEKCVQ